MPKVSKDSGQVEDHGIVQDCHEVFEPGDAFYVPPGHTQRADAGTEYVQFSPTDELKATEAVITRNMQEMQGA